MKGEMAYHRNVLCSFALAATQLKFIMIALQVNKLVPKISLTYILLLAQRVIKAIHAWNVQLLLLGLRDLISPRLAYQWPNLIYDLHHDLNISNHGNVKFPNNANNCHLNHRIN